MRPKPNDSREFMKRYPRITAHIISESLGYATPTTAARIGLDGMYGRENYCEWIYSCYGRDAREALNRSIRNRHYHKGHMSWYKEGALPLVRHAIEKEEEPIFASSLIEGNVGSNATSSNANEMTPGPIRPEARGL